MLVLVLLAAIARADEIQTKDGKKIEFKALVDMGDSFEITTPTGAKVTVKKEDFDKLVLAGAKEAPLTGASFTFDKKLKLNSVNLLGVVNPKKDSVGGEWSVSGAGLAGTSAQSGHVKCQVDYPLPEEYDLAMTVERKDGKDDIFVGLVGGGRQFTVSFDSWGADWAGLALIDGNGPNASGLGIQQKVFSPGKERQLKFMVRKEGIVVQVDGKDFMAWKADWSKISVHPSLAVPKKNVVFVGIAGGGGLKIKAMTVSSPKEK
jgi:hypothetical protein